MISLTWPNKDQEAPCPKGAWVQPPGLSVGTGVSRLYHGDNYAALSALQEDCKGKFKCIYLDPPYNTQHPFEHYMDALPSDEWLSMMKSRLKLIWPLLHEEGSLWISIDDAEGHYLKVLCDELFGRAHFITTIIWEKRNTRENRRVFSVSHDYILVYAKTPKLFKETRNQLPPTPELLERYKNLDNDPRGPWQSISAKAQAGHATASQFYDLKSPTGVIHRCQPGTCWVYNEDRMQKEIEGNNIWFGKDGKNVPRIKKFLENPSALGLTPHTLWKAEEVDTNASAKQNLLHTLKGLPVFDTPKPEKLLNRILSIATNSGDWVLDPFAGSGVTGAVANQMNRNWVLIEQGEHCRTHIRERLKQLQATYQWFTWESG